MKKITLLILLLTVSLGYSQSTDLLQDFESGGIGAAFGGLASATAVADPASGGTNGTVAELITSTAGEVWQGVNIDITSNVELTTQRTMTIDVYSTSAISILVKVTASSDGGPDSSTAVSHTGSGWETLTATFDDGLDGTAPANGTYTNFVVYPNWDTGTNAYITPPIDRTVYVDNITGKAVTTTPDPEPATAAPVPTTADGLVYSIYNDTNSYTNTFNVQYGFGTASEIDLDATSGVNNAFKVNLNADGFGQGEGGPDDISSYDYLNFNYWYSHTQGTPGFTFILIDNDGAVQEFAYQIGDTGAGDGENVVQDTWAQASIPMSHFTGLGFDDTVLFQWKVDRYNQSGDNGGFLYLDNITFTQGAPLSRDEFSTFESTVYPNPASDAWTISTPNNTIRSVQVFNVLGRQVASQTFDSNQASISVQSLASGIYLARVTTDAGTKTLKLIRE